MQVRNIRPLTSLRFAAALLVFFHHFGITPDEHSHRAFGVIGVGFFFMLSGLILAHVYNQRLGLEGRRRFYIGRFAKIYPLHLTTAAIALVLVPLAPTFKTFVSIVFNLSLLQAYVPLPEVHFSLNWPSWSLSDEMFFYAVFPFVLPWIIRINRRQAAFLIAGLFCAMVAWALACEGASWNNSAVDHWAVYLFPPARLAEFVAGVALWRILADHRIPGGLATVLEIGALGFMAFVIFNYGRFPVSLQFSVAFFIPCLVLLGCYFLSGGAVSSLLSMRLLVYLGEISFAFYMVHKLLIDQLRDSGFWVALAATLVAAAVLHHAIEKPAQRMLTRHLEKWALA